MIITFIITIIIQVKKIVYVSPLAMRKSLMDMGMVILVGGKGKRRKKIPVKNSE